jgi:Fic family protein
MASNRLTRQQVEEVYRTNKLTSTFEPVKVDDIIEIVNHFAATKFMVEIITEPLSVDVIRKIYSLLSYGTYAARKKALEVGEFRTASSSYGVSPNEINRALSDLISHYEHSEKNIQALLEFHVKFESIRPFKDYNGRVGRLLLMKECLRHQIDPFIIDDKRRGEYNKGILTWRQDPYALLDVVSQAQSRFRNQLDTCRLMEYSRPATGRGAR